MVAIHFGRYGSRLDTGWTQNNGISHLPTAYLLDKWKKESPAADMAFRWTGSGFVFRCCMKYQLVSPLLDPGDQTRRDLWANRNKSPIMKCGETTKKNGNLLFPVFCLLTQSQVDRQTGRRYYSCDECELCRWCMESEHPPRPAIVCQISSEGMAKYQKKFEFMSFKVFATLCGSWCMN